MSTQKNLITLCFAAVFTLGLAACGGGGGGDAPVTGTTDIPPTGPMTTGGKCGRGRGEGGRRDQGGGHESDGHRRRRP